MSDSTITIRHDSRARGRRWRGVTSVAATVLLLAATLVAGAAPANAGNCGPGAYCAPVGDLSIPTRSPAQPARCTAVWNCGTVFNTSSSGGSVLLGSGVRWQGDSPSYTEYVGRGAYSPSRNNVNWQLYWVPIGSCGSVVYGDGTKVTMDRRSSLSGKWAPLRPGLSTVTVTTRWCP